MYNIIDISDFTGSYKLPVTDYNSDSLQDQINKKVKDYLVMTIGILLYNDFYNDLQTGLGTPTQERWQKFLNGDVYEPSYNAIGYTIEFEGIKPFLIALVYGDLMRDPSYVSDLGFVEGETDGATRLNLLRTKNKADYFYNIGRMERIKCYEYLCNFDEIYENFGLYYVKLDKRATLKVETIR